MIQDTPRTTASGPLVPIRPEPLSALQARYLAALVTVYDHEEALLGTVVQPGARPQHVFDLDTGVRLIVSRTRLVSGEVMTHFSCSCQPGTEDDGHLRRLSGLGSYVGLSGALGYFITRWHKLSQTRERVEFLGFSENMVPHFRVIEQ